MTAKRLLALAGLSLLGVFVVSLAVAQTAGDFQSFQTGNWNDVNSWERYDGGSWVNPAPNTPTTADGVVTILSGHTITVTATDSVDQLTVASGGTLAIDAAVELNIEDGAGSDLLLDGTLVNAGSVTLDVGADIAVGSGGVYQHAQNGGTIPTAAWGTGSTCEVTGAVGNAPGNANQDFFNFTWNCPGQTSNLNVAWDNITIGGDVTVVSTGSNRFQFTSSTYSGTTITINGNLLGMGGQVASNGSSGQATYTVEILGDVVITGGNLGVSRGSGGNATWRLHGDMSVTNATIQSSNPQSRFVFVKTDTQRVSAAGVTISGTFHYEVDTSTTLIIVDGIDAVDVAVDDSLICRGEVVAEGTLVFEDGAVYVHARNGGSVPVATWATGSTCLITGVTSSSPSNTNQDFYHYTWNCPGQSSNLDWGWYMNTISGDVSVLGSGGSRARLTSPGASPLGENVITVLGDIIVDNAQLESNGSGSQDTITVDSYGNLSATNGALSISRGSGPMVTWNVRGDFTLDNSTTQNSGGTKAEWHFMKDGLQNLTLINPTFGGGGMPIVVDSGATLNLGTGVLGGSGIFTLSDYATLQTAAPGGLDEALANTGAITLSPAGSFTFNGTVAQVTGFLLPDSLNTLTCDNAGSLAVVDTVSCVNLQTTVVTQLNIVDTASVTAASGNVFGTIVNQGELVGSSALIMEGGAAYQHDRDGGSIPTATWSPNSSCIISGATGNAPGNANQDFYHFLWNCPSQASNLNVAWSGNTIGGNLTLVNSASSQFRLSNNTAILAPITINGDVIVESGILTATGSSGGATYTIYVHGDAIATGGSFAPSRGSGGVANWYIEGDFNIANAELRTSNNASRFILSGTTLQTVTLNNVTWGSGTVNMDVDTGATVDMGTSVYAGTGTFTVLSGATLYSGHPSGLDGNLTSTAVVLSNEADYGFNGSEAQSTGLFLPLTVKRLVIDNSSGVTLTNSVTVTDSIQLVTGTLALGANALSATGVLGGSPTAYIVTDGTGGLTIPGIATTTTHFPVGTSSSYAPVWISDGSAPDDFTVTVAPDVGLVEPRVDLKWNIVEGTPGGSTGTLTFGWMAAAENAAFSADRAANAKILQLVDTTEAGGGAYTPQLSAEPFTLSRGSIDPYGYFTVGNFTGGATAVEGVELVPTVFAIGQNYPNPFNPTTVISYDVPSETYVSIRIYDALGRVVTDLVEQEHVPGFYTAQWNASGYASGVYYYRIVAGDFVAVKKMMLVR